MQEAIIESFKDRSAILRLKNGQTLNWPISQLPEHLHVGDSLQIKLISSQDEENQKMRQMRTLLQDLIN